MGSHKSAAFKDKAAEVQAPRNEAAQRPCTRRCVKRQVFKMKLDAVMTSK